MERYVYYYSIIEKKLAKEKKPALVKFVREYLGEKVPAGEKKEVFLSTAVEKFRFKALEPKVYEECFGWDLKDIGTELTDQTIKEALDVWNIRIYHLHYKRNLSKDAEKTREITKVIKLMFKTRHKFLTSMINTNKATILGRVERTHVSKLNPPMHVKAENGEKLKGKSFIFFPNMKYCAAPPKDKSLDLNNIKLLGEYRLVDTRTITEFGMLVKYYENSYFVPKEYLPLLKEEVVLEKQPRLEYKPINKVVPEDVDDLELEKTRCVLEVAIASGKVEDKDENAKTNKSNQANKNTKNNKTTKSAKANNPNKGDKNTKPAKPTDTNKATNKPAKTNKTNKPTKPNKPTDTPKAKS
jgi:hypothetical protein